MDVKRVEFETDYANLWKKWLQRATEYRETGSAGAQSSEQIGRQEEMLSVFLSFGSGISFNIAKGCVLVERGDRAYWTFNSSISILGFSLISEVLNTKRVVFLTSCVVNRGKEGGRDSSRRQFRMASWLRFFWQYSLTWQVSLVPRGPSSLALWISPPK